MKKNTRVFDRLYPKMCGVIVSTRRDRYGNGYTTLVRWDNGVTCYARPDSLGAE